MELVFILFVWEIVLLMIVLLMTSFDFTCPSFITLTMFTLSTFSLIMNYQNWGVVFSFKALLIMGCGLTTLVIVEAFTKKIYERANCYRDNGGFIIVIEEKIWVKDAAMKCLILVSSVVMMLFYIKEVKAIGRNLNLSAMISAIGAVKQSEYHTSTIATLCLRIGYALSNLYGFIFCHNVILSHDKVRKNIYLLIAMVTGVISSFYSGSRSMMLGVIFAFIFYIVTFSRISIGWREFKIKKYMKYIIPVLILFIVVFYFSRSIVKNREYTSGIFEYITYYLGNSQQLFNLSLDYPNSAFPIKSNLPGLYTFQFLYNELAGLGLVSLPNTISSGFMYLGSATVTRGNVYTLFGEPYHDFGFVGMLIYVALFYSIFAHYYYKYIRHWKNSLKSRSVLLIFGSQYYLVLFTFYLAPTIWIKMQTLATIIIVLFVYKFFMRCRFRIGDQRE